MPLAALVRRPLFLGAVFSLLLHLFLLLFNLEDAATRKQRDEEKKLPQQARLSLQTVPLATEPAPVRVQVFREDLFKDPTDEEKKLFTLRKTEDKRRTVTVDQDRSLQGLLLPDRQQGSGGGDTNSFVPFYSLDTLPEPRGGYGGRITWPDRATALGITAFSVVAELLIDEKGKLRSVRIVTSGDFGFGDAVLAGLAGLEFRPGKAGGRAVRSLLRERFYFSEGGP